MSSEESAPPVSPPEWCTAWRRALNLFERSTIARKQTQPPDAEHGCRRLEQWRSQAPFGSGEWFERRLRQAGLSESQILAILSDPRAADVSASSTLPAWATEVAQAYASSGGPADVDAPTSLPSRPDVGFLELIRPLIDRAIGRLHAGITALVVSGGDGRAAACLDAPAVEAALLEPLLARLSSMLMRTMTLELHVARLQEQLSGATGEERFASFIDRLRQPAIARALLCEYPVLARQVVVAIENWLEASLEFLGRWRDDYETIRTHFACAHDNTNASEIGGGDPHAAPGPLVAIAADAGDSHRGGRTVIIATCASGMRIVYKPKPLAVDRHFQELLERVNALGFSTPLRTIRILDRGEYGWVEFVTAHGCTSHDEVSRFYRRQGGYLALLYVLAAMDFHHENVIAAGEQPVMIDVEAVLHPRISRESSGGGIDNRTDDADGAARAAFDESVLACGLLPQRLWLDGGGGGGDSGAGDVGASDGGKGGFDVSGIGAEAGGTLPWQYPAFAATGTDEMHFARRQASIDAVHHRPTLDGADISAAEHVEDLEAGFREMYTLLLAHRDELLTPGGWLDAFADDPVRAIFRGTSRYGEFLSESFHPDVLRDALDRDRLFDRLWEEVAAGQPSLERLIPAEVADLWRNDVPFFVTRPGSRDAWGGGGGGGGGGGERIGDVFAESGISRARGRIARLGEEDLSRQLWFIRASMTTLQADAPAGRRPRYDLSASPASSASASPSQQPASIARMMSVARAVGDRLIERAFFGGGGGVRDAAAGDASWIGLTCNRDGRWSLLPLGADLYDGVPGVALFLAYLGATTAADPRYTDAARRAVRTVQRWLAPDPRRDSVSGLGAYSGWGGIFYALAHLATLWREPQLLAEAAALVEVAAEQIEADEELDIIGGAAGCIAGLLTLDACSAAIGGTSASPRVMEVAIHCGEHLLARARSMPVAGGSSAGVAWDSTMDATAPLTGFSHGAAGIGWSLLELAARTGDARFRAAGIGAIAYERSVFSREHGNWPDFRRLDGDEVGRAPSDGNGPSASELPRYTQLSWCHGAPGIGLARLRCLRHLRDDSALRAEIDAAVGATLAAGFGFNHTLCHGDLGNLELPLEAARAFPSAPWRAATDRILLGILDSIEAGGFLCANPGQVESPGLMTGLAGIGYAMLRHARPDAVPSILALDPPVV